MSRRSRAFFRQKTEQLAQHFEIEIKLHRCPVGSDTPLKKQLLQVYKTTGKKPKELTEQPECPRELEYILQWWLEVRGSEPLTFTELQNWSQLTHKNLRAWEVDLIRSLDRIYWNTINDNSSTATDSRSN
ncbi:phage tail assembly chaperone [Zooshikella sp. RANM57]|uniref:phage tail assembly chaperone n=1 Tax=Zooshikella sp. RANM57 TaxID=3425863 RepID=UPI003D6F11AF